MVNNLVQARLGPILHCPELSAGLHILQCLKCVRPTSTELLNHSNYEKCTPSVRLPNFVIYQGAGWRSCITTVRKFCCIFELICWLFSIFNSSVLAVDNDQASARSFETGGSHGGLGR